MKKATLVITLTATLILQTGCEGKHENAVITCWGEPFTIGISTLPGGVTLGSVTWYCTIQYEDPDNGSLHNHRIDGKYHEEHKSCKDKGQNNKLTADVTISAGGQNNPPNVSVGPRKCG